jgi:uncharacterized membrane protein
MRDNAIQTWGDGRWKGTYSLIAGIGLALAVWGWMQYRLDAPDIYFPPEWGRHATSLLVLIAFVLMAAANAPSGRIKSFVVHPFLLAILCWSIAHLLVNGDLASIILFGSFLIYAIWNGIAVIGRDAPKPSFKSHKGDVIAIVGGGAAFLVFAFWLHLWLFGVSPF